MERPVMKRSRMASRRPGLRRPVQFFTCGPFDFHVEKALKLASNDGERRLLYDAKAPIFAPPAVSGDVVYVADLKGIVHAIDLKTSSAKWQLDLGADPLTKAPGMVYGGITVQDGKLYLATCNLDGAFAGRQSEEWHQSADRVAAILARSCAGRL